MNLCCPACGHVILVGQVDPSQGGQPLPPGRGSDAGGTSGLSASGSPGHPQCRLVNSQWQIDCPLHGTMRARFLASVDGRPAVVKCTGKGPDGVSGYCDQKTPADEAKRMAGIAVP